MEPGDELIAPELEMQIEDVKCYTCGNVTRVVVKEDHIDWKLVAEQYRKAASDVVQGMNEMMQDINVMHGGNPIEDYISNQWKAICGDWENKFK